MKLDRGTAPLLLLLGTGCPPHHPVEAPAPIVVAAPPAPARLPSPPDEDVLPAVLRSAGWAIALPRERQAEEIDRWDTAVQRDGLPSDRLRLALLTSLGAEALRDPNRTRTLLQGEHLAGDLASETLARLLLELADVRLRRDADARRLQRELEDREAELEELRGKLEALGAIEMQMHERDREEE